MFSCIPNILRTKGIKKYYGYGFLSYTKNYLPGKNQEYSMISNWDDACQVHGAF